MSLFVKKKSKKHSKKKIIKLLKDRWALEAALDDFDHGYFTDYKEWSAGGPRGLCVYFKNSFLRKIYLTEKSRSPVFGRSTLYLIS